MRLRQLADNKMAGLHEETFEKSGIIQNFAAMRHKPKNGRVRVNGIAGVRIGIPKLLVVRLQFPVVEFFLGFFIENEFNRPPNSFGNDEKQAEKQIIPP